MSLFSYDNLAAMMERAALYLVFSAGLMVLSNSIRLSRFPSTDVDDNESGSTTFPAHHFNRLATKFFLFRL